MKPIIAVPSPPEPPKPPKDLKGVAADEWRRAAAELHALGVLNAGALGMLEIYCRTFAEIIELEDFLVKAGPTFETLRGYVGQRPEVAMRASARSALKAYATALGLTPAARARLGWKPKAKTPAERMADMRGQFRTPKVG